MKKLLLVLLFIPILAFSQWNLIGLPINGEAIQDWSGSSISLSTDGNVLAVGAVNNDGSGFNSGHVRVYENISGTWTQIGNDINGEAANDYSSGASLSGVEGAAISLNSDGSVIAIGAPANDGNGTSSGHVRVFQNISGVWMQVGQDIDGTVAGEQFGTSVDLNSDGTVLVAGAPWNSSSQGVARVYELISGSWVQKGTDLIGEASGDFFGGSVSLNMNGNIAAIGAKWNDGSAAFAGHVRVYSYTTGQDRNAQGTWIQLGSDIDGEAQNDQSGCSVSLNVTGNIVAIGAKYNTAGGLGNFSGHVRVYERISNVWTQVGSDIDSSNQGDEFGYSVSISSDGMRVAAGARLYDGGQFLNAIGHVRIFDNISGVWTQVYSDITGPTAGEELGTSVSISGDGFTVATGAPLSSSNGLRSGQARVFQDQVVLGLNNVNLVENQIVLFPNPTNNYFEIGAKETLSKVEMYSLQGQIIKSFVPQKEYDISDLSSGVYFVKIQASNNEITKRIVKK